MAAVPYVAPPGQPNGGDAGARAAGFGDYAAYQQARDQANNTTSPGAGGGNFTSGGIVSNAKDLNKYFVEQNQPVIAAKQAEITPLKQRYDDLISSIKTNQGIAENRQTVTTQNELGRRGVTTTSGLGAQELTNALNPVTSQYTQMIKDTTGQENSDIAAINSAIAALQAGNPSAALSTATGLADATQRASEAAAQQALATSQVPTSVVEANGHKYLVNTQTGETIKDLGSSSTSGGGVDLSSLMSLLGMGGSSNDKYSTAVDEYVKQYGLEAAQAQGLVGPRVYAQ